MSLNDVSKIVISLAVLSILTLTGVLFLAFCGRNIPSALETTLATCAGALCAAMPGFAHPKAPDPPAQTNGEN